MATARLTEAGIMISIRSMKNEYSLVQMARRLGQSLGLVDASELAKPAVDEAERKAAAFRAKARALRLGDFTDDELVAWGREGRR